ncbi:MAG TPA: methyltransferase [Steroidobacteraceae bacterium]|nr:methyltransferase [Steroidobacteraceae bacterium]
MRLPKRAHDAMLERIAAYWQSQLVFVAAKLGIADVLVAGPLTVDEIAARVGAHPPYLKRVLRALASVGIFASDPHGRFHLTRLAQTLRSDHPESLRNFALMLVDDYNWSAWGALEHSVRTGTSAFEHVHGAPAFLWMREHPEKEKMFSASMASLSAVENAAVARAYAFAKLRKVVDVGGAHGHLLAAILRSYIKVRGVLFDQPPVIEEAGRTGFISAADVAGRCEAVGGDFFESVPAGADAYVLKYIIHDWDDEKGVRILQNCRKAMAEEGRVLVVDHVVAAGNKFDWGKLIDINMMVMMGSKERTKDEFRQLFARAGLRLKRVIRTASSLSILEGVAG